MARINQTPFEAEILDLGPDGRGIARRPVDHPHAGKTVLVAGALAGERVLARQTGGLTTAPVHFLRLPLVTACVAGFLPGRSLLSVNLLTSDFGCIRVCAPFSPATVI